MDEPKKNLFELLDPKSAFIIGVVGGLLCLGTLGFVVLGSMMLKGNITLGGNNNGESLAGGNNNVQVPAQNQTPPPPEVPKSSKPKVELFVMSYCPYGLQMEKAYVPAWELLKNKADISLKFVNYIMHGAKEAEENTRQYCIQKEQPAKFAAYLKCFYTGTSSGAAPDYKTCLASAGVNESAMNSCYAKADKQFSITAKLNDQSTWLSGQFPLYTMHESENNKYGVQGSPTLVINGVQANVGRTPEAVKQAICAGFENPPAECNQTLSTASFQAGFGLAQGAAGATNPGCGT